MKYRFKIIFRNKYMKKANELLKTLDLDCGDIGYEQEITFTANDEDVSYIKKQLKNVFESGELEVLRIEGGKIE